MHTNRLRTAALIAAVAATLAMLVGAAPATAADQPGVSSTTVSTTAQAGAAAHWTPQRLRAAHPGDELLLGRTVRDLAGTVSVGVPQLIRGRQAGLDLGGLLDGLGLGGLLGGLLNPGGSSNGGLYDGGGQVVKTTGKVFFTMAGEDFQCSGSSVRAASRDLVVTAGHCVNAGPGAFATNVVFIPGYRDGTAPYGTFPARTLTTTNQFRTTGDLNYDVGMVAVSPVGGAHLADTVGAQGIAFNQARGAIMYAFGYPAASPYDGSKLAWCHAKVVDDTIGDTQDQGLDCNLTGGASGGPWFMGYDESTGLGAENSLNSFKYESGGLLGLGATSSKEMYGPYFGSVIQSLYTSAQGL